MTDAQPAWTEGYIAEVEYTTGFYSEMAPALLCFAALLKGVHAPAIDRPFTYFELGCGQGLSANLLAAANPLGRFFANDFNPTHVLNGRALAAEAGIGNVTFLEKSFGELAGVELPEFDFITLHGVYSWISEENRRAVVDFIRRRLRPGGVVYVSYNSLPGWAPMAPLRRLMTEYAMHQPGPMPAKIAAAVDFGAKLKEAGAKYFGANPTVAPRLDRLRGQSPNYLAHEYFNLDWALLYHADVVRDMAGAKLSFVGSANLVDSSTTSS
jgi:SAM-dependent methyltransferase